MKTVAFFNNKGGVGKTTLVYHLAWMFSELGLRVVAVDLDPQSNLTTAFLTDERMEELWDDQADARTVLGAVQPLLDRLGDLREPHVEDVNGVGLIPGDLGLYAFEDRLAAAWPGCLDDNIANAHDAFRVMTAFHRMMLRAAEHRSADLVVIDVGPNMGAINRAALVAADFVVVPLSADLFSLRGLNNLGPRLREWRTGWETRRTQGKFPRSLPMPVGQMKPIGYVVLQHAIRQDRPVQAYLRWMNRIPRVYRRDVLGNQIPVLLRGEDKNMLATLKHYRSLMPLAHDARKPVFALRPADGAVGSHAQAVTDAYKDFERLARRIAERCDITLD